MEKKSKFKCTQCNWKFTRNYNPQLCPYCGRAAVEVDLPKNADEILSDIDKERFS